MKTTARTLLAALPLLCTPFALAQHQAFNINPDSSTVSFTLGGHDTTNGTFGPSTSVAIRLSLATFGNSGYSQEHIADPGF